MSTKLYVGNLSFDVTENDLRDMLAQHGPVNEINVIMDKDTGRARGFAFATMNTEEGAKAAILGLNGKDWKGRALTVNEARPREERAPRGGGGYGGGRAPATNSSGWTDKRRGILLRRIPLACSVPLPLMRAGGSTLHPQWRQYGRFFSKHSR